MVIVRIGFRARSPRRESTTAPIWTFFCGAKIGNPAMAAFFNLCCRRSWGLGVWRDGDTVYSPSRRFSKHLADRRTSPAKGRRPSFAVFTTNHLSLAASGVLAGVFIWWLAGRSGRKMNCCFSAALATLAAAYVQR